MGKDKLDVAIGDDVNTEVEEMSPVLSKEDFMELADFRADCCATIYIPTHQSGVEVNEKHDVIVFKNALQDLSKQLAEKGYDAAAVSGMLTPGYELLKDDQFWTRLSNGLAVFIAEGFFKYVKLSEAPAEMVNCGKRFSMSPLIPQLASKDYFYLLVISKHQCKLFRGDSVGMERVEIDDMPEDVMEVKRLSDKDASTVRIGVSSGTGGANFHGISGGNPDDKTNTAVYFEAVDDLIYKQVLHDQNVPLLLAGVEYLIPIYKSVCDYHNVWPDGLTGSHEHTEKHVLHAQAKEMLAPHFKKAQDEAAKMFANQIATPLTSSMFEGVVPAAYYGRISHLFVEKGAQAWGTFDENENKLMLTSEADDEADNLVDMSIIKTLANGGAVFAVSREEMPTDSTIAAVFRY